MAGNLFFYLYNVVIGHIVGVEGYGVVNALLSAILLFSTPAIVAGAIVAKLAADLHAANDGHRIRRLADLVDRTAWLTFAGVLVVVVAAHVPIERFFHLSSSAPVVASGTALGLTIVATLQRAVLQGRQRFSAFVISNFIDASGRCVLGALGALRFGVAGAILGVALGLLLTVVFNALAVRLGTPRDSSSSDLRLPWLGKSALQIGMTLIAINAMLYYDTIFVRHFFDAQTAGLYGAAALVARAFYLVVGFVPVILLPKAAQHAARGERSLRLLLAAGGVIIVVGALAVGASIVAPVTLVSAVAGPAFAAAGPYVLPYVCALVALAGANAVANYRIGLGSFGHAIPLAVIAFAQVATVLARHHSVNDVLLTILVGDFCALASTLYGINALPAGLRRQSLETR